MMPNRRMLATVFATLCAAVLNSCVAKSAEIRVGKKAFVEQDILAEVVGQLITAEGVGEAKIVGCGDTFGCQQALRNGRIDVMVEYTGTGFLYSGSATGNTVITLAKLREAYSPGGLEWLEPLGFDNGYRVVLPINRAAAGGIETIADLVKIDDGNIRVACPSTYLRRPHDGLASLLERHGLRMRGEPIVEEDATKRLKTLRNGSADVAIVYATDAALRGRGLLELRDSLRFFPPYDAAILASADALHRFPALGEVLGKLSGRIDNDTMQELNYRVEVEGWTPTSLARGFLADVALVVPSDEASSLKPDLVVATAGGDRLDVELPLATRAVRVAFPGRRLAIQESDDPSALVADGRARLAVIGAERFFREDKGRLVRETRVEAIAVVGTRLLHVIRQSTDPEVGFSGRVGVEPRGSGSALAAEAVLRGNGLQPASYAARETLLARIRDESLDAAIVLAAVGDRTISEQLAVGGLRLEPMPALGRPDLVPYLRAARIPENTYPSQMAPVDTLSTQVVIVGASRAAAGGPGAGPAAALPSGPTPLTVAEAEALARGTGVAESPEPSLPSAWTTWSDASVGGADAADDTATFDSILNLAVLAFLGWLLVLVIKPEKAAPDDTVLAKGLAKKR